MDVAEGFGCSLDDLPEPLIHTIFGLLNLSDLALCACVSKKWASWAEEQLARLERISLADFVGYPLLHNYLLLGDGGNPALKAKVLRYLPSAFLYISKNCRSLQQLHLELPAPPEAINTALERMAAAEVLPLNPQAECPPVDGFLVKLVAQGCPQLRSLRCLNVTNNRAFNRLVHINDAFLAVLAKSCPQLQDLHLGHLGGQENIYSLAPYYCEDITDMGIKSVARGCTNLRSLGLLRCNKVTDQGLGLVAHFCRQLTALRLHDCPEVSDAALVEVGECCPKLRSLDVTISTRVVGLLMGEEVEQVGFRALFTIAANCPLLEEVVLLEAAAHRPTVDDDCLICLAQGCRRLRRLELRRCSGVTDTGIQAVASRCKELQELVLEHTGVGDAGIAAIAKCCPRLRKLSLTVPGFCRPPLAAISVVNQADGGPRGGPRSISDAALVAVADHCRALEDLELAGSCSVTDTGIKYLASPEHTALHHNLRRLAINHTAATEGSVCELLMRCKSLRSLGLRGLLFNADSTMGCIAHSCRDLKSIDLRHCSTLSDAGLAVLAQGCPHLEELLLSFCTQLSDVGVCQVAAKLGSRLRRLELYHVPQLTEVAVKTLAAKCGVIKEVNLGKCAAMGTVAGQLVFLVQACHYVDY